MPTVTEPVLVGYKACKRCDSPVLEYLAFQTRGECWTCFQEQPTLHVARQLEAQMGGVIAKLKTKARPKKQVPSEWKSLKVRTRRMAARRLIDRHHEEFHLLWQEERIKAGIPPAVSAEMNILASAVKTIDDRLRYLRYIPGDDDHADQSKDA